MSVFKHKIKVSSNDIDQMGHVNNVVYLSYVQQVAEAHWKHLADDKMQQDILWVVLRHEIDYKSPAFESEELVGETWVEEPKGVKMPRNVIIKNVEDKVIIRARTVWCAIDGSTKRPKRVDDELYQKFLKVN